MQHRLLRAGPTAPHISVLSNGNPIIWQLLGRCEDRYPLGGSWPQLAMVKVKALL